MGGPDGDVAFAIAGAATSGRAGGPPFPGAFAGATAAGFVPVLFRTAAPAAGGAAGSRARRASTERVAAATRSWTRRATASATASSSTTAPAAAARCRRREGQVHDDRLLRGGVVVGRRDGVVLARDLEVHLPGI